MDLLLHVCLNPLQRALSTPILNSDFMFPTSQHLSTPTANRSCKFLKKGLVAPVARDKVHQADKADKASGDWPQFAGILKGCTVLCCSAAVLQCLRLPFSKPSGQASPFWTETQFEDPDSKLDLGIMQSSNMLIKRQHLDTFRQVLSENEVAAAATTPFIRALYSATSLVHGPRKNGTWKHFGRTF